MKKTSLASLTANPHRAIEYSAPLLVHQIRSLTARHAKAKLLGDEAGSERLSKILHSLKEAARMRNILVNIEESGKMKELLNGE